MAHLRQGILRPRFFRAFCRVAALKLELRRKFAFQSQLDMPLANSWALVEVEAEFGGPKGPFFGNSSILGPGLRKIGILAKNWPPGPV